MYSKNYMATWRYIIYTGYPLSSPHICAQKLKGKRSVCNDKKRVPFEGIAETQIVRICAAIECVLSFLKKKKQVHRFGQIIGPRIVGHTVDAIQSDRKIR